MKAKPYEKLLVQLLKNRLEATPGNSRNKILCYLLPVLILLGGKVDAQKPLGKNTPSASVQQKANAWIKNSKETGGFTENRGQLKDQEGKANNAVKYLLNMPGLNVQLRQTGFSYDAWIEEATSADHYKAAIKDSSLKGRSKHFHRVDIELDGANPAAQLLAQQVTGSPINVINGTGKYFGIQNYRKITYQDIYPGIDLEFEARKGNDKPVEYNFIVHPGADASLIKLKYNSDADISLKNGEISMKLAFGTLTEKIPASYTQGDGHSLAVQYKPLNESENLYAFNVPDYDKRKTLVIDPTPNLVWATYYGAGGSGNDAIEDVDLDATGNIYIAGVSTSSTGIATAGTYDNTFSGSTDHFLVRLNSAGTIRLWGTYIGSDANSCVLKVKGAFAYLGGRANAGGLSTTGAFKSSGSAYIAKFNTSTGTLAWCSYYGAINLVTINSIDITTAGDVVFGGWTTSSTASGDIATNGTTLSGNMAGFIAKLSSTGATRLWGTYVGTGATYNNSMANGGDINLLTLALDASDNIYVGGYVKATTGSVPVTAGAHQAANAGGYDGYLAKYSSSNLTTNNAPLWCTYYGGTVNDAVTSLLIDNAQQLVIQGYTASTTGISSTATIPYQSSYGGGLFDLFAGKFNLSGVRAWSTYYGNSANENTEFQDGLYYSYPAHTVKVDENNNVILLARTSNFSPVSSCTYQYQGAYDYLIIKLSSDGKNRLWATTWGTTSQDLAWGLSYAGNGEVVVVGTSSGTGGGLATPGAFQTTFAGAVKGLVGKFNDGFLPSEIKISVQTLNPLSQTACILGIPNNIVGNVATVTAPPTFTTPVFYQWQTAPAAVGPWTNVPGEVFKDITPLPASTAAYYRRIIFVNNGTCLKIPIDTSATAVVNISAVIAPIANADGPLWYLCASPNGLTLNGSATGGTAGYTYAWFAGSNFTTAVANIATYSPSNITAATTYTLQVTDAAGCKDIDQTTVTSAAANAGTAVSYCQGSPGVRIGTQGVIGTAVTYSWSPGTGLSCSTCAQPIATPTIATIYTLTCTVLRKDNTTCNTTSTVTVTPVTAPNTSATYGGLDKTICKNTTVSLGSAADAAATYTWSPGTYLSSSTSANPTFNAGTTAIACPFTYVVTAIKSGCTFTDNVSVSVINPVTDLDGQTATCGAWASQAGEVNCNGLSYAWSRASGTGNLPAGASLRNGGTDAYLTTNTSNTVFLRTASLNGTSCASGNIMVAPCGSGGGGGSCPLLTIKMSSPQGCPKVFSAQDLQLYVAGANSSDWYYSWTPAAMVDDPTAPFVRITSTASASIGVTLTNKFTGLACSAPSLSINNPSWSLPGLPVANKGTCPGTAVSIGEPTIVGFSYVWSPAAGLSGTTVSNPIAMLASSAVYNLIKTEPATGCIANGSVTVSVSTINYDAGNNRTICNGATVTLGSTPPAGNQYTYVWTPALAAYTNSTSPTSANPQVLFASSAQPFNVTVTDGASGCTLTDAVTLSSIVTAGEYAGAAPAPVCPGAAVQLGRSSEPNAGYIWTPSTGLSCTTCSNPIAVMGAVSQTYTVKVDYPGCSTPVSDNVTVTVKAVDPLVLTNKSYCPTAPSNIGIGATGNTVSMPNAASYSWSGMTGLNCSNCANPTAAPSAVTTYTLIATMVNGCTVSASAIITPTLAASAKPDALICSGGSVILGSQTQVGVTYVWSPSTGLSATNIAQPTATPTATITYTLTATASGCTVSDNVTVTVNAPPAFTLSGNQILCKGANTFISSTASSSNSYFQWSPLNGVSTPNSTSTLITPIATTTYRLTQIDAFTGCSNYQAITITVPDSLVVIGDTLTTCAGIGVMLPLTVTPDVPTNQYSWTPVATLSNQFTKNPTAFTTLTRNYAVTVTNTANNCVASTNVRVVVTSGCLAYDYGDAPASYEQGNSASHFIDANLKLGAANDGEGASISADPYAAANGDDLSTPTNDEESVSLLPYLNIRTTSTAVIVNDIRNNTGSPAYLAGWIDWNHDGDFDDANERSSVVVIPSGTDLTSQLLNWNGFSTGCLSPGTTYMRIRISTTTFFGFDLSPFPTGYAGDGEVEDYTLQILGYDYTDAPASYGAQASALVNPDNNNDGKPDIAGSVWLGNTVDCNEGCTGNPANASATGDDADGRNDDDAIVSRPILTRGTTQPWTLRVNSNGPVTGVKWGMWIDWDNNGSFADAIDGFYTGSVNTASPTSVVASVVVPAGAAPTYEVRLGARPNAAFTSTDFNTAIVNGEWEDYTLIFPPPVAQNLTAILANGPEQLPALSASDPSGSPILSYVVNPPATGILQYCSNGATAPACTGGTLNTITSATILTPPQEQSLYYLPVAGAVNAPDFTYTATSVNGTSNVATVTMPLYNLPPVSNGFTTAPIAKNNTGGAPVPPLPATDPENGLLIYNILAPSPAQGSLKYCSNGTSPCTGSMIAIVGTALLSASQSATLSFIPATNFTGTATFAFTTTDNAGNTSTAAAVNIPVTPVAQPTGVNIPPVSQSFITEPITNTAGNTKLPGLLGTDIDGTISGYNITAAPTAAQGILKYCSNGTYLCTGTLNSIAAGGAMVLTIAQAATLQFIPAANNAGGMGSFTYTTTDNSNAVSNISTVSIPIQNPPPAAQNVNSVAVAAGTAFGTVSPPKALDNGSIANYIFTTAPNEATQGILQYCSNGTVAPACTGGTLTKVIDNASLTPAQVATLVFSPVATAKGDIVFPYTATDNNGAVSNTALLTVPIIPVQQPLAKDFISTVNTDVTAPLSLSAALAATVNGTTGATITSYKINSIPPITEGTLKYCSNGAAAPVCTGGSLTPISAIGVTLTPAQAASLVFYPNSSYSGPVNFDYIATDNTGIPSNPASVLVLVTNLPPVAQNVTTASVKPGGSALTIPLNAADQEATGTISNYVINTLPPANQGTLKYCVTGTLPTCTTSLVSAGQILTPAQAATVTMSPSLNINTAMISFTYSAIDNTGATGNVAIVETPVVTSVLKSVVIAQNITAMPTNGPEKLPPLVASSQSGNPIISYSVTPPTSGTLQYCSNGVAPPVCTGGTLTTISVVTTLTPAQQSSLYYTPVAGSAGTPSFTYTATAAEGLSDTATMKMPVYNLPPTAIGYTTPAIILNSVLNTAMPPLQSTDPEGAALTYTVTPPSSAQGVLKLCSNNLVPCTGTLTAINSTTAALTAVQVAALTFTPATGFTGTASFTFTTTDNASNISNAATVNIPVTKGGLSPGNIPPVTQNIVTQPMLNTSGNNPVPALAGADIDGTVVGYTITTPPPTTQGILSYCSTGDVPCTGSLTDVPVTGTTALTPAQALTLKFNPNPGFTGNAGFNYTATDNGGAVSNISAATIPVFNTAPLAENIMSFSIPAGSTDVEVAPPNATDNGSVANYIITTAPNSATQGVLKYCTAGTNPPTCTSGSYSIVASNTSLTPAQAATLTFTPVADFLGNVMVSYTATDNNGLTGNSAELMIPVQGIQPPTALDYNTAPINANSTMPLSLSGVLQGVPNASTASPIASYMITSVPPTSEGLLKYCSNGATVPACTNGTLTTVAAITSLTTAQAASLVFYPNSGYAGPVSFAYTATDEQALISNIANVNIPMINIAPVAANVTSAAVIKGGTAVTVPLTGADPDGTVSRYIITSLPPTAQGALTYCITPPSTGCTTAVTAGLSMTPAQAATVKFTPAATIITDVISFTYTVKDNDSAVSNTAIAEIPVIQSIPKPAIVAQNITATPANGPANLPPLSASTQNGSLITGYTVTPPANGTLQYCTAGTLPLCTGGALTTITSTTVLTPPQEQTLYYTPLSSNGGTTQTFTYTATSEDGQTSGLATVSMPLYNLPPVATSMTTGSVVSGNNASLPVPPLQAKDPDDSVASFKITPPAPAQGSLTYCSNGTAPCTGSVTPISAATVLSPAQTATLKFSANITFTGVATFTFTATDNNGHEGNVANVNIPVTVNGAAMVNIPPITQSFTTEPMLNTSGLTPIPVLAGTDPGGSVTKFTITKIPLATEGGLYYCQSGTSGCASPTLIALNTDLTPAQAATLQFYPATTYAGGMPTFNYTATDNFSTPALSNVSVVSIPVLNTPPLSANVISGNVLPGSTTKVSPPTSTDNGGTKTYNITTPPNTTTQGTLNYCTTGVLPGCTAAPVTNALNLTAAQIATLTFTPIAGFTGNVVVPYTATDSNSLVGNTATITIPVRNILPPTAADFNAVAINANTLTPLNLSTALVGTANPANAASTITSYTITSVPTAAQGALTYCTASPSGCGTPVTAGLLLSVTQKATLQFLPNSGYTGPVNFGYIATDNLGGLSNLANVYIPVINIIPAAQNITTASITPGGTGVVVPLSATDMDGTVTGYKIRSLPPASQGTLSYCATGTLPGCTAIPVIEGQLLTLTQAATIWFIPKSAVQVSSVSFLYSAVDNTNGSSNMAVASIPVTTTTPLPIRNLTFTLVQNDCRVNLQWIVKGEEHVDYYELQRSYDGRVWNELMKEQAHNKTGTQQYGFTDLLSNNENHLYRLQIMDNNGSYIYSNILKASGCKSSGKAVVNVYPNSTKGFFTVDGFEAGAELSIYDMNGKLLIVKESDDKVTSMNFDLSVYAAGIYQLVITNETRKITVAIRKD